MEIHGQGPQPGPTSDRRVGPTTRRNVREYDLADQMTEDRKVWSTMVAVVDTRWPTRTKWEGEKKLWAQAKSDMFDGNTFLFIYLIFRLVLNMYCFTVDCGLSSNLKIN